MNRQQTSNLLERMFYSLLANYSISMICALTLVFLVNIVHYYAIPQFEPVKYSFLNVVIQRVAGILSYISLYIISKKCRSQKLIVSINIIVPIAIFEFTTYVLNYWESYLSYVVFYNSFREIILLNINTVTVYFTELIVISYHLIRAIIFKHYDKSYPLFSLIAYLLLYIFINFPILNNYITIKKTINENDTLRRDFENMITAIPLPVIKFSINPINIIIANQEFETLVSVMGLKNQADFINLIIDKLVVPTLTNENPEPYILRYNKVEYLIKYRLLEQHDSTFVACIQDLSIAQEIESLKVKEMYKKMFISVINHHLRTPLNGIYAPLNLIKESGLLSSSNEYLELALYSLDILSALIDDTISFSECENGNVKINCEQTNMKDELDKLNKMFLFDSRHKNIALNFKMDFKHSLINCDCKKIKQILIILISNAFKYTFKGSITLSCTEEDEKLQILVGDTGIGIKEECLDNVFKEFSSVQKVNDEKLTSSGFQLSLVKKYVELMGGNIKVESTYNQGTSFYICIPVQAFQCYNSASMESIKKMSSKCVIPTLPEFKLKKNKKIFDSCTPKQISKRKNLRTVLVVDDNAANVFVLQKMLGVLNVKSDSAMNGIECLERVAKKDYSIIFMDINMPIMNGIEATKNIKKLVLENKIRNPVIVVVTAQNEQGIIDQCVRIGIDKCIFKPVKMIELKQVLEEFSRPCS